MPIRSGLPKTIIEFFTQEMAAVQRSRNGVVCCIVKDDTEGQAKIAEYRNLAQIDADHFTEENYLNLKLAFIGTPYKVIAVRAEETIGGTLALLEGLVFNWLCMPEAGEDISAVISWVKNKRESGKRIKAVLAGADTADSESIVNFAGGGINIRLDGETEQAVSSGNYTCRIAGILGGLPMSRSCTYLRLPEVTAADAVSDPDEAVDDGKLFILFDGDNYKLSRGVNSLTTLMPEKGESFTKIKIMEGMDQIYTDFKYAFENYYIGKVRNDYGNKQILCGAFNAYLRTLAGDVLDPSYDNRCFVSYDQNKMYLESKGTDTENMSELEILSANTGSKVFIDAQVKFVDAMEDLYMKLYI